jgi:hypothetical protein
VLQEVGSFLKFLGEVYDVFGLDYSMALSTRPEGYLGELELWNKAEEALTDALNNCGRPWTINEGEEGAAGQCTQSFFLTHTHTHTSLPPSPPPLPHLCPSSLLPPPPLLPLPR